MEGVEFQRAKAKVVLLKGLYEALLEEVARVSEPFNRLFEEGKMSAEEWAERTTNIEFEKGLDDVHRALMKAEEEFLQIGRRLLEARMTEEQKEQIREVWNCPFVSIREEVLDILLRWDPTS